MLGARKSCEVPEEAWPARPGQASSARKAREGNRVPTLNSAVDFLSELRTVVYVLTHTDDTWAYMVPQL